MKVSDWIKLHPTLPVTVTSDESIEQLAETFLSYPNLRDLYISSPAGRILGFIRHRRLAHMLLAEHLPVQSSHQIMERVLGGVARELMERDFVSAHPGEELDNVLNRMLEYEVEDLPVVDDSLTIVGNINLTDVLREALKGEL